MDSSVYVARAHCYGHVLLKVYREEKSLRHVAMVAKVLYDNKPKKHLKVYSHYFKLHRSYSISFNLANYGEISLGPYLTLSKFR